MMSRKKVLSAASCALGAIASASFISPAVAQEAEDEEEIVVTGSLLRRQVSDGSQLVTTVDAEQLDRLGAGNAVEALASVAQNQPVISSTSSFGARTGFGSYASLRSLGASSTLVLFDSQRVATNPYNSQAVDLNTIPLAMVERVETLADGASSVYGSDAIAGVVNYIPRREFEGFTAYGSVLVPEQSGGERYSANIAGGFGSLREDGWNIYAGYSYRDRERIAMNDRDFASVANIPGFASRLQNRPTIANWTQTGTVTSAQNPSAPACNPALGNEYASGASGVNSCSFNYAAYTDALSAQTDQSFIINGAVRLGPDHTASLQYFRSETDLHSVIAPNFPGNLSMVPANPFFPGNASYPTGGPALPGAFNPAANVTVVWRMGDLGAQTLNPVTTVDRFLAQLEGEALGWDYEIYALRSTAEVELYMESGWARTNGVRAGLDGTTFAYPDGATINVAGTGSWLNPFGPQSTAGRAYLDSITVTGLGDRAEQELESYGAQIARDLFQLPGGPMQIAFAANYTDESNEHVSTADGAATALASGGSYNIQGERQSYGAVVEARFPITDSINVDLSLRYDHFSDFGETTNPKIMISWDLTPAFTVRGSYNEGFRAPTLVDVNSPFVFSNAGNSLLSDPILCPGGTPAGGGTMADCAGGGGTIVSRTGGNPDIGPETSQAFAIGFDARLFASLEIGADYWSYRIKDSIGSIGLTTIANDLSTFGDRIIRCSDLGALPIPPASLPSSVITSCGTGVDRIAFVNTSIQNLGEIRTSGIDFTADWQGPETPFGQIWVTYRGTQVLEYDFQAFTNGPLLDRLGRYVNNYPVFEYSHFLTLGLESGDFSWQLSNRYKSGYVDCNQQCGVANPTNHEVDAYTLWDATLSYEGIPNVTLIGSISNLLDEEPPLTNKGGTILDGSGVGWDERFTDATGRAFMVAARVSF
ncbi:TonB-dependent receptor plug domain-containing protein [Terricaulis sp.]|uniref:TonB-dependent receptor plug domain-containing protein n=1 Tax=Terricaulis sp. TaxID=2768686 RepID=UPI003783B2FE